MSFQKLCGRQEWLTKHKLFRNMFLYEDQIKLCGLTSSFSQLYTSPSSSYDLILHVLKYVSACCAGVDILEVVPSGLFRFLIAAKN
jgi:hypothetical protein